MKRLDINLASVAFRNRALPITAVAAILGLAFLLTVFNLWSFIYLGGEYRSSRKELKEQEGRMASLRKDLADKEAVLSSASVASFSQEAIFVKGLLDGKRTSWVSFLEDLEKVKAYGVLFQNVNPQIGSQGAIQLSLRGQANPRAELLKLEQNFFADPKFKVVQLSGEQRQPGNPIVDFTISCSYRPGIDHAH